MSAAIAFANNGMPVARDAPEGILVGVRRGERL